MNALQRLPWFGTALLLAFANGCGDSNNPSARKPAAPPSASPNAPPEELVKDVGRVIAGQVLAEVFTVRNSSPEPVAIQKDEDIRPNCGCSGIIPEARTLEPGAQTRVTVTVHSDRLGAGGFTKGGTMIWTAPGSARRTVLVTIKGEVLPPLCCEPGVLRFEPADIRDAVEKELTLSPNLSVDWETLRLQSSSPHVRVSGLKKGARKLTCRVRCVGLPDGLETFSTTLTAQVRVPKTATVLPGSDINLQVPVIARREIDLSVTPRTVPFAFDHSTGRGTARLLLRGTLLDRHKQAVRSVRCDGFEVRWTVRDGAAGNAAVLEVVLTAPGARAEKVPDLVIELASNRTLRLPAIAVGKKEA